MIDVAEKFINCIEENYHNDFTEEKIINITGYSYQHFNRCFKEICNMTIQTYRRRRQLTLIALEIKNKSGSIKGSDLSPWADNSTFSKAFKREFNMTPSRYIKGGDFDLQEKIKIPPSLYIDYMSKDNNKSLEERYEYLFYK